MKRQLIVEDTRGILSVLFGRLYTLRNQLFHGGSSSDSDINQTST